MNKNNGWGVPMKGDFRIIRNEEEFIQSGGNQKSQKMIAQAAQILSAGKEFGCAIPDSLIADKAALLKKLDGLVALHVKASMITGTQMYSDGFSHLLGINGDSDNLYDPSDIIAGQGVEFRTMKGQNMSSDIKKIAVKAYTANCQTERDIKDLLEVFAELLKNIQTANVALKSMYLD